MVHLTQYLCENRHCIMAAGWEQGSQEIAEQRIRDALKARKALPLCALCGSTKLHFETRLTAFKSLPEALLPLKICEAEQRLTSQLCAKLPKPN